LEESLQKKVKNMKQLIEDYKIRLKTITEDIENTDENAPSYLRKSTKASCYREFINEMESRVSYNVKSKN